MTRIRNKLPKKCQHRRLQQLMLLVHAKKVQREKREEPELGSVKKAYAVRTNSVS